jgi:hypothetical protein
MAGSPLKRQRKAGVRHEDGGVIAFPFLRRVAGADKPPGWDRWSLAEKVEHLLGMSLDRIHDYLGWPPAALDPHRLAAQVQAVRVVMVVAAKVGPEARRERDRQRVLEELARDLQSRQSAGTAPEA